MKSVKILTIGAAALLTAQAGAETVIHFTGSTAFRSSTVAAVESKFGGAGSFKAAYWAQNGVTGIRNANQCVIQGTIAGLPAGANPVTIKCSWSGSTGGIKTLVQNLDVTTWMSTANLPGTNISVGVGNQTTPPNFTLDTTQFPGESLKAEVTMEDSAQATTGFTTATLIEKRVGVLVFEWVAGNGTPVEFDTITPIQAEAVLSNGALLSQFTGNPAHTKAVYMVGRNFDSGTRLCSLANIGVSVFSTVSHVQPQLTGSAGQVGGSITALKKWPAETVLGQAFGIGQSGFSSGGTLADNLATPGSDTAATPAGPDRVLFGNGYLIGMLGRGDAQRATRTSVIPNTARRLKWNGFQLANGAIGADGIPAGGYNDHLVKEGMYSLWEYQNLAYRDDLLQLKKDIADSIAIEVETNTAQLSGTRLDEMHVSKPVEGGLITHN